ncbi:3-isopropylmalate dehydratase small subunit [Alienimonas chondri]|uniref:3-isopropylmalate dehydratase n=1 Tax=Alienimonas chondri TaxID=2681879 RepID=A0ABX1VCI3_9PLAN|nr:3-isopropylmalate dehydratase small subunit [Alienimonas chondri]NNJ25220.1 3-isopropylmalate dehydratase small subunit [Alienimonas chondri]
MSPVSQIVARGIPLPGDDIDTDRIIPARFLRCVTFDGLGEHAFEDDRAQDASHPFDDAKYADGGLLVTGNNFGCGSSREHAPQSLMRAGVRAIIAGSFAEIFAGNCTNLGVACATATPEVRSELIRLIQADPTAEATLDLEALTVTISGETYPVAMADGARDALLTGQYDFLAQLLEAAPEVAEAGQKVPYLSGFKA